MNRNTKAKDPRSLVEKTQRRLLAIRNIRFARRNWGISPEQVAMLKSVTEELQLSVGAGDLRLLDGNWYVTHAGLLRIAQRSHCSGMRTTVDKGLSDPASCRWVFKATVYKSPRSRDSSATVTPIRPMSPPWSTAPKCASLKPAPSTAPSARPTASGSVRSRNLAGPPGRSRPNGQFSRPLPRTEIMATTTANLASATASAC